MTDGIEASRVEILRASVAFGPFVRRWRLQLNPEDVDEIVYAVLLHARSIRTDEEIVAAVEAQIDQHEQQADRLREAMGAEIQRRKLSSPS